MGSNCEHLPAEVLASSLFVQQRYRSTLIDELLDTIEVPCRSTLLDELLDTIEFPYLIPGPVKEQRHSAWHSTGDLTTTDSPCCRVAKVGQARLSPVCKDRVLFCSRDNVQRSSRVSLASLTGCCKQATQLWQKPTGIVYLIREAYTGATWEAITASACRAKHAASLQQSS